MRTTDRSRWQDVRAGMLALLGLLILLVGIPVGLWALAGWPLPTAVPSLDAVSDALGSAYVPDTFLAKVLALVCWVVWFELLASVVVEGIALVRGRRAADVPLAGPMQRVAAHLVAAIALLAVLGAARSPQATEVVRPLLPSGQAHAAAVVLDLSATETPAAAPAVALPTYTVESRDTLWDISERHLADPMRWNEIWELNRGKAMPDGTTFTDPNLICPGWQLSLPGDAVGLAPTAIPASFETMTPVAADDGALLVSSADVEVMTPQGSGHAP
jgi:hypothetical protein